MNTEVKKAAKTPVKVVATVVSPNGGNVGGGGGGGVVTTTEVVVTTPKSSSSVSSSYASASTTTTASSTTTVCSSSTSASTAQLHQDCRRSMEEDNATVKQVIKMLVAVVVLFVLCWAPLLLMNVLRAFELVDDLNHGWLKHVVPCKFLFFCFLFHLFLSLFFQWRTCSPTSTRLSTPLSTASCRKTFACTLRRSSGSC